MDAITLSTAQLVNDGRLTANVAWRIILVAAMANMLFKAILVLAMGNPRLGWRIAVLFAVAIAGGAVLLMVWPDARIEQWSRVGRDVS